MLVMSLLCVGDFGVLVMGGDIAVIFRNGIVMIR